MKKYVYFLIMVGALLFSCKKVSTDGISNLNGNRIGIIGHGGLGFPSPENHLPSNSRSSILQAVEGWQADGVDLDIQMSSDSVLVLYHDGFLSSLTDCTGCVVQLTAAELLQCRYRQGFNTNVAQEEKVISLKSILARFKERRIQPLLYLNPKLNFPCTAPGDQEKLQKQMARQLSQLINQYAAASWTVIETSNLTFATMLMQENPELRLIFAAPGIEAIETARNQGFFGLLFLHQNSNSSLVEAAHAAGLQVFLWGVIVRKDVLNAVEQSPDWLLTDNIPLTIGVLK